MSKKKTDTLAPAHGKAQGLDVSVPDDSPPAWTLERYYKRYKTLRGIPGPVIRKAWFAMSHLLLPDQAKIADMGCGDGTLTYVMAALNPGVDVIGIDHDKKLIAEAEEKYRLPNLSFRTGDILSDAGFDPGTLDAVVNSFSLHAALSQGRYNERRVIRAFEYQLSLLKQDGILFIRDHALHNAPDDYVLMEMPDDKGTGKDLALMSESELLIWYSEKARPRETPGCHGFFLEELPPRFPQTRLFRLPYKWAYEFVMRKDERDMIEINLHRELAFFTEDDFGKTLRALGARALYTAPHWNDAIVSGRFEGRFRLYDGDGSSLGPPPTSFTVVAQKAGERKSLSLQERRPAQKTDGKLRIAAMRNDRTGKLIDIATRDIDTTEVIPYRLTSDGQLNVYIHDNVPRGIINAVPRNGQALDGKRWSGHMVEAIAVPTSAIPDPGQGAGHKETVLFARDYLGLKPLGDHLLEEGGSYYPAPESIDEVIKTRYLRVAERDNNNPIEPRAIIDDIAGFTSKGRIREVSAQKVLDAITVGLIPNARLELQILALYDRLEIEAEVWEDCPLVLDEADPETLFNSKDFMRLKASPDTRFKKARGTAGQLRAVQSVFVDEGFVDGGVGGIAARNMEFVIGEEDTPNRAVILPMTKSSNDILIGFEVDYAPAPQRHEGNGLTLMVPSVPLPREVTTMYEAQKYIAELFKVPVSKVWRMGESYFCHSSVTPQRIFPFALSTTGNSANPTGGPVQFAPLKELWRTIFRVWDHKNDTWFLNQIVKAKRRMGHEHDLKATLKSELSKHIAPAVRETSYVAGSSSPSIRRAEQDNSAPPVNQKPQVK